MIKDSDIKRIIGESGPQTLSQISHKLIDEHPNAYPTRIYRDVNIKAHGMVKYRELVTIQHDGREYFALPEDTDIRTPDIGPRPHNKIRAYIEALPDGSTLTYRDIMARFGVCSSTAYTVLRTTPGIRKTSRRPLEYTKGA